VTKVVWIDPAQKVLRLKDTAANTVSGVTVTSDDGVPIQDAVDSLSKDGGTVYLPPGKHMVGTKGAVTNQPIVLGSTSE
jgi:polygalacturonase